VPRSILVLLAVALGLGSGRARAAPPLTVRWMDVGPVLQQALLKSLSERPLSERLSQVSSRFVGTPYAPSPLGEGRGFDPDPSLRFDAVDCLTFVEETIALALSRDLKELHAHLQALRYRRDAEYEDRNHLMEAQWLPNNLAKGYLRDVTVRYGGTGSVSAVKLIGADAWNSRGGQSLRLPKTRQVTGAFPLRWIPLEKAPEVLAAVPSGTLMVVVREDRPYRVTRVSHLGFLFRNGSRMLIRHAAKSVYARVVDEDLAHFLARNARYAYPVQGVALYQITEPGPVPAASVRTASIAP